MATYKAPKQWKLGKIETLNSFENWKQNPHRGSAITMVCCDGKELPSIQSSVFHITRLK